VCLRRTQIQTQTVKLDGGCGVCRVALNSSIIHLYRWFTQFHRVFTRVIWCLPLVELIFENHGFRAIHFLTGANFFLWIIVEKDVTGSHHGA